MGIEHQRIHMETSSVIIRRCRSSWSGNSPCGTSAPRRAKHWDELLPVAGGRVVLGKSKDHPLYGWDNS